MPAASSSPSSRHQVHVRLRLTVLGCALVFAVALRSAWSTLDRYFIGDDFAYVGRFFAMPWSEWPGLFVKDWSGGVWGYVLPELRPFAALTFLLDAKLWRLNPLGYHLTNFFLDAGAGCLVFLIGWRLLRGKWWQGLLAGLLFVSHPVHAESVAWITGRVDLAATLCYLTGFFAAGRYLQHPERRSWLILAWMSYAVGCFTKEFCLTLPLMLLLWAVTCGRLTIHARKSHIAWLTIGFLAAFGLYALCRKIAFGGTPADRPPPDFFGSAHLERQSGYLHWMFSPVTEFLPAFVSSPAAILILTAALSLVGMALWRWLKPKAMAWLIVLCFGFGWYIIATLPLVVVTYFSPRHVYLATAGFCLAVVFLFSEFSRRRWLAPTLVGVLLILFVARFDRAVTPWRHAAKVSENLVAAIDALPPAKPGELLLLDVPEVFEGVWLWSWATPFAISPPFINSPARTVIERPTVYFATGQWARQRDLSQPATASGAILLSIDETQRGTVTQQAISAEQLRRAAPLLQAAREKTSDVDVIAAWRQFVAALNPSSSHP